MKWLPICHNFRERLIEAKAAADVDRRLALLTELAHWRLTYLQVVQLNNAVVQIPLSTDSPLERVKLAFLAGSTVDHLSPHIRVAGLRHGFLFDIYVTGFGQFRQEMSHTNSLLHQFRPEFALFTSPAQDFIGSAQLGVDEANGAIENAVRDLQKLWGQAAALGARVLQQTFVDTTPALFGSMDSAIAGTPARNVARLNSRLSDLASGGQVVLLDIARASARDGLSHWFDRRHWFQARMEIAPGAALNYGEEVARLVGACRGRSRKCLVLDLDNTLWSGVLGDDGLAGILLGQGNPIGEAHLAVQAYAKALHERGVILAVCSKNDEAIARAAVTDHPDMVLRLDDFAAFHADWTDKADALIAIAGKLNIGLESLVFVDDNPAERERVRLALPMVATPELPEDPAEFVEVLSSAGYFESISFTPEDAERNASYAANTKRADLRFSASGLDDFLGGLGMTVAFGPLRAVDVPRAAQLINKTNQFNTANKSLSEADLSSFRVDPDFCVLTFRLADRFGDFGLVSVVVLRKDQQETHTFDIECWVMSCRVFGRRLEHEIMNIVVETARGRGARTITARFVPTARNTVIKNLFAGLGFSPSGDMRSDSTAWRLDLTTYSQFASHISRSGAKNDA